MSSPWSPPRAPAHVLGDGRPAPPSSHPDRLPDLCWKYVEHAGLVEEFDLKSPEGRSWFLAVSRGAGRPFLVVAQRYGPSGGFHPGALLVPETDLLFVGAGERLLAYRLDEPARLWMDTTAGGFWGWARHGDWVILSAELSAWTWFLYNSGMILIHLDDATHERLRDLRREPLPPKVRDRIGMLTLADAGWSAPRIAAHLGYCRQTVRDLLRDLLGRGIDALYPCRTGPATDLGRRGRVAEALRVRLAEDRTWTSRQLAEALAGRAIEPGPRQVRRHLKRLKAGYRRTASTLKHKQDRAKAQRAGEALANLKARAAAGSVVLYCLDECGFSPTLPVGYGGSLPGRRKFIRYEAPGYQEDEPADPTSTSDRRKKCSC